MCNHQIFAKRYLNLISYLSLDNLSSDVANLVAKEHSFHRDILNIITCQLVSLSFKMLNIVIEGILLL